MNVTIEHISKYQPTVLHLLPFTGNKAGQTAAATSSSSMVASLTTTNNQPASSYAMESHHGAFPSLGPRFNGREKPRSKSAAEDNNRYSHTQQQQRRLLRATSERLSRSQRRFVGRSYIERAQSEYSVKADRKLTQEVVTFAIKDINEQILGRTRQQDDFFPDSENMLLSPKFGTTSNNNNRVMPLLKPVLRPTEGRWPQTNPRFWRSSTISPGERELQRHKTSLDIQLSAVKRSKHVKLNVNDLPRSQTPIGENDPDRLNMKHVIAFLQSSGEVSNGGRGKTDNDRGGSGGSGGDADVNDGARVKSGGDRSSSSKTGGKPSSSEIVSKANGLNDNATALVIAAKSRRKGTEKSADPSSKGLVKSDTFLTQVADPSTEMTEKKNGNGNSTSDNNNNNNNGVSSSCDNGGDHHHRHNNDNSLLENGVETRVSRPNTMTYPSETTTTTMTTTTSNRLMDDDVKHRLDLARPDYDEPQRRPRSIQFGKENTEFRIPARIRQIRESTVNNRPFRLHRFLTLVSNPPEDKTGQTTSPSKKDGDRANGVESRLTSTSSQSRFQTRSSSSSKLSKDQHNNDDDDDDDDDDNRETSKSDQGRGCCYVDSRGNFQRVTSSSDKNGADGNRDRHEGTRRFKRNSSGGSNSIHTPGETERSGKENNVICLPTVPVDADSDDDFITVPTVPSKATRKDLTLSANGRAILAKNFPQATSGLRKPNVMKPHSEKILLKRRLDICSANNNKTWSSTVKPSDLIEWGGMENPGKIFLTDQKDELQSNSNTSPHNSNSSPQNANHHCDPEATGDTENTNDKSLIKDELLLDSQQHPRNSPTSSKMNSPTKSGHSDEAIPLIPSENQRPRDDDAASSGELQSTSIAANPATPTSTSTNGKNTSSSNGTGAAAAKSKPAERLSPSLSDPVRLTMRKERNLTRESTYMVDMKSTGNKIADS